MSDDHPYHVAITATAARDLQRLPERSPPHVSSLFSDRCNNPHRLGKPLRNDLEGLHSARRGDYRVVYAIDDGHHRVEIIHIARRSASYRMNPCRPR